MDQIAIFEQRTPFGLLNVKLLRVDTNRDATSGQHVAYVCLLTNLQSRLNLVEVHDHKLRIWEASTGENLAKIVAN